MNSCSFWQTEVKLEAKTVGTAMDMLASQLWNNPFQVQYIMENCCVSPMVLKRLVEK